MNLWGELPTLGPWRSALAEEDGKLYTYTVQSAEDNQAILDENSRMRSAQRDMTQRNIYRGRHVARIPITLAMQWEQQWKDGGCPGESAAHYMAMKVNDRSFSQLRTVDKKVETERVFWEAPPIELPE